MPMPVRRRPRPIGRVPRPAHRPVGPVRYPTRKLVINSLPYEMAIKVDVRRTQKGVSYNPIVNVKRLSQTPAPPVKVRKVTQKDGKIGVYLIYGNKMAKAAEVNPKTNTTLKAGKQSKSGQSTYEFHVQSNVEINYRKLNWLPVPQVNIGKKKR